MERTRVDTVHQPKLMAREHTAGESGDVVREEHSIDIRCPQCDRRLALGDRADTRCPNCDASFSVRIREEFALIERRGWTVAVALEGPKGRGAVRDG